MARLGHFNCDTVPVKVLHRANEYVQAPNFTEKALRSKSAAAGEIGAWVIASVNLSNEA